MIRALLISLGTLLSVVHASGQNYVPMQHTVPTPYGKATITTYQYVPMQHYYGQGNISGKYEFYIILNNDSTFSTKTRIDLTDKENHSITVKEKKEKRK